MSPATPPVDEAITLSAEQFQELKSLILQVQRVETETSLDLTRVLESGLGTLAGNAIIGLMGKTSLEEKVDYLIKLVVSLVRQQNGAVVGMGAASSIAKPTDMVPLNKLGLQKAPQTNTKQPSSGFGMMM